MRPSAWEIPHSGPIRIPAMLKAFAFTPAPATARIACSNTEKAALSTAPYSPAGIAGTGGMADGTRGGVSKRRNHQLWLRDLALLLLCSSGAARISFFPGREPRQHFSV